MIILYVILIILVLEYVVGEVVDYLNLKHELKPISPDLAQKFTYSLRKKMHLYHMANYGTGFFHSLFSLVIILTLLYSFGFGEIDSFIRKYIENEVLVSIVFFAVIGFAASILSLPWEIFNVFYIENRFGFNRQSAKLFIQDKIKGLLLTALIGGVLLTIITYIYYQLPDHFWWVAWVIFAVFSLFMTMFYSSIIVPLFNKQKPLEEGSLRNKIEEAAKKADFKLDNIFVIDGSKRSSKSNAYFTGLGSKKRIVLYDTLINDLEEDEIVAVLSHEIGHYKKKHIIINLFTGILQTGLILFLFDFIASYDALYEAIGAEKQSFHLGLLVFGFLFTPLSIIISLAMSYWSRKAEYQADGYAAALGYKEQLKSSLIKLTDKNLSNINPHPTYVFMHYSHPPLNNRLQNLDKY
ncbi:MAG: peptidase M48 [Salinivirgaceae bacterium]|nr:MAG: peptidase M48 [Salinivirgaceae bacterium]